MREGRAIAYRVGNTEDLELARRARRDDAAAGIVARRLLPRIRHTVRLLVDGHPDAGDLVQQCMLAIIEGLGGYSGSGSLEGWAGGICYRVVMRQMKRRRRSDRMLVPMPESVEAQAADPASESVRARVGETLERHLARLPESRRAAVVLHAVYGYKVSEVAGITEAAVDTVRDRLRTGLRDLRASLARDPVARDLLKGGR